MTYVDIITCSDMGNDVFFKSTSFIYYLMI